MRSDEAQKKKRFPSARRVIGAVLLIVAVIGFIAAFTVDASSAPQQTVQELRYIKWVLVGVAGLLIIQTDYLIQRRD